MQAKQVNFQFKSQKNIGSSVNHYGIILAGGEGKRLQSLVYHLRGDHLPKQYVNFIGKRSMLEHTFHRVEKLIFPEFLFSIVNPNHLGFQEVVNQLAPRPKDTVIFQPENKDTAPGLLLPLMHIYKENPDAVVSVFPSDQFVLEEALFMSYVEVAFRWVEQNFSKIVLLGVEPGDPETEYGYILPVGNDKYFGGSSIREVSRFVEKPNLSRARELVRSGGLWNTLVMTFKAKTLLEIVKGAFPQLFESFQRMGKGIGTTQERRVVEEEYQKMVPVNFSRGILEELPFKNPSSLLVLSVQGVYWSDWGSPNRLIATLSQKKMEKKYIRPKGNL
jgi:mannose-1-phosphate guanylyltransferase